MKFCWSTLTVRNMEESLRFYQEVVGLPLLRRFAAGPDTEIAFLGDGETKIELICRAGKQAVEVGPDISWGFEVDSLDDCMAGLKEKSIPIHSGPFQPNPHSRFLFVTDPNGLKIQFVENL
jgi:lactoylglutathione lyase